MKNKIKQNIIMKQHLRIISIFVFLLTILPAMNAFAADDISVLKVDTLVMEKGSETYSLTVKAFVRNNGPTDNVAINVVAVDINGFELQNTTLSGPIEQGKTRVLVAVVKIPKDVYHEIVRWEWKK